MKEFVKMTLAVICGFVVVSLLSIILCIGAFGALLAVGNTTPSIPDSGVLVMDMSKFTLAEQSAESDPLAMLAGDGEVRTIGILDAIKAVNTAAADPAVKYIYLKTDGALASISAMEEFRGALEDFRKESGKAIVSYMEGPSTASYYLASVSDKIYMTSYQGAMSSITGVGSQMIFLGDLLDRLGVNMQLIRHGKYKSAGEMYTRSSSSPENRAQYQRLVDSLWETLSAEIAESRGISVEELNAAIDGLKLNLPQDFVDHKLVDALMTKSELEEQLAVLAVEDDYKDVAMIQFADYVDAKAPLNIADKEIAVIYADGEIIDGTAKDNVAGDRFANIIAKVRADSTVKAVVLRVNSPGGSVLASEKIKNELDKLQEVKPLVASYGDYAASGGYWISNKCDKIYSAATTLTGSIGVFSIVPDLSKTMKNIAHINIESVTSNKHGDMLSGMRAFDQAEYAYMQRSVETIYELFTKLVSEGRQMPVETVDAIGQGRVWTGADALTINLVDEIGTLEDAIKYAAGLAGDSDISNWQIGSYPRPQSQLDQILSLFGESLDEEEVMTERLKEITSPKILARMDTQIEIR